MKSKSIFLIGISVILMLLFSSCNSKNTELEQFKIPEKGEEIAVIETDHGIIKIRLFPEIAPKAVENFKTLAREGYYNGKTFHRIRKDDFIMAVDSLKEENYKNSIWGEPFEDEFNSEYCHFRGAVSMANRGANTNESSFFIVKRDYVDDDIIEIMKELGEDEGFSQGAINTYETLGGLYELDFKHTVFGQVFEGIEIVDAISNVDLDFIFEPMEPVIIKKVEIVKYE